MTHPQSNVLDYASPQPNRRRPQRVTDRLVFVISLLQFCGWVRGLNLYGYHAVAGRQWSLFAWCWRYTQDFLAVTALSAGLSLLVLCTSTRPAENRLTAYKFYMLGVAATAMLYWLCGVYLSIETPGVWGSLLDVDDPTGTALMVLLGHPAAIVLVVRMLFTGGKLPAIQS